MIVYFLFYFIVCSILFLKRNKYNLIFICLFLFSALRFKVGTDYDIYYEMATNIGQLYLYSIEPFNILLFEIGAYLNFPQFFFIVTSFFISYFIVKSIVAYSIDPKLSIICFVGFPLMFMESLNTVRQYVAISIIFYAFDFLFKGQSKKFALSVLLASFFHLSAIVGFLYMIIYKIKVSRLIQVSMFVCSFIGGTKVLTVIAAIPILSKMNYYLDGSFEQGYGVLYYIAFLINILNLWFYKKLIKLDDKASFYITSYNIGVSIFTLFKEIPVIGGRVFFYFLCLLLFIFPLYPRLFKQYKSVRIVMFMLLALSFFFILIYSSYLYESGYKNRDPYIPYTFFFLR